MASRVIFSDLELFLTGFLRGELLARGKAGGFISNEFSPPDQPLPRFQVIVRDDSGPRSSAATKTPTVGITLLGSDAVGKAELTDLALLVMAIMEGAARVEPGNPVAAVLNTTGPYKVADETGQQRRYLTVELSITGTPFA